MEKGRISTGQMVILLYPTVIATAILLVPGITGKFAGNDMWLSPIWASLAGCITILIMAQLHNRFPRQTIIQYSEEIIGKIPGKLIGFIILFFFFHSNGLVLREYGEFVVGNFLPTTPLVVVIGSMIFVSGLAVRGGIEVMARSAQVFVPIVLFLFILIVILLIPDLEPANLLPFFEKGLIPSLKGAIVPTTWFLQLFAITFILPVLKKKEGGMKWGMITVFLIMVTLVLSNLFTMLLFGKLTPTFTYPIMEAARYISIADFIQHLESIVMAIWVSGTFIKISVFYYVIAVGTAQLLNLQDYRPIVFPIGGLLAVMGLWTAPNLQQIQHFLITTMPFYAVIVQIILPLLLLIAAVIFKKNTKKIN
ncbi:spore gernimation protein [Virgibacillus indicus]|uniref:Spore gernimation protein n=1 Tax=Virgibacillus indicus TaxID=2024554 RepID=A0A265NFU8_9BACI|nr:spore gernimation protein [Virgibacillus indicus]